MKRLILVRHSITKIEKAVSSHLWCLSNEGIEKAKDLSNLLLPYGIEHIFTSQEKKTIQTAESFARALNLEVKSIEGLEESQRHTLPFFENPKDFKDLVKKAMSEPYKVVLGEESMNDAQTRFSLAVARIRQEYAHLETIAIVSHGTVLSLYLAHLTGNNAFNFWSQMKMPDYYVVDLGNSTVIES